MLCYDFPRWTLHLLFSLHGPSSHILRLYLRQPSPSIPECGVVLSFVLVYTYNTFVVDLLDIEVRIRNKIDIRVMTNMAQRMSIMSFAENHDCTTTIGFPTFRLWESPFHHRRLRIVSRNGTQMYTITACLRPHSWLPPPQCSIKHRSRMCGERHHCMYRPV